MTLYNDLSYMNLPNDLQEPDMPRAVTGGRPVEFHLLLPGLTGLTDRRILETEASGYTMSAPVTRKYHINASSRSR